MVSGEPYFARFEGHAFDVAHTVDIGGANIWKARIDASSNQLDPDLR